MPGKYIPIQLRPRAFLIIYQSQAYVMQLASIPGRELDDANVRLVVIGCGSWDLIPSYKGENLVTLLNWTRRTLISIKR